MKIYFAAATSSGRKYLKQCMQIVNALKKLNHKVLSEHIVNPNLQKKKNWIKDWDAKRLYQREREKVARCDLMISEISAPSLGVGLLTEYALALKKPALALFYKDNHAKLSLMIKGHPELYVESYDEDNLNTVLQFNLKHFNLRMKSKGKLIVIDGTNGSGKATQTKLLMKYFIKHKIKVKYISYPRYYTSFHGKTVARFLTGEFGKLNDVSPYLSSLAYALDRLTSKNQILDWLNNGNLVVADRYITSNLAHQGAKLTGKERQKFINWIYDMEYKQHRMPKENLVIYLYVPPEISEKLILERIKRRKRDIEEGLAFQIKVAKNYLALCKKYKHWVKINCIDKKGNLKTKKEIHQLIIQTLKEKKIVVR